MELILILIQSTGLYLESNKASRRCVEHIGQISQLGSWNPGWGQRENEDRRQTWTHIQWSWDLVGYSNTYHLNLEPQNAYEVQHRSGLPNPSRRSLEASSLWLWMPSRRKLLLLVFAHADQSSINIHTWTPEESFATALEPAPGK